MVDSDDDIERELTSSEREASGGFAALTDLELARADRTVTWLTGQWRAPGAPGVTEHDRWRPRRP